MVVFLSCPGPGCVLVMSWPWLCSCHVLMGCVLDMSWWVVFLSCPGELCSCHVLNGCVLDMSWWVVFLSCPGWLCS